MKFGFVFQIADDILDYVADEKILGKSLGKDLEEGKITLPLIYLLRDADDNEREHIKDMFRTGDFAEKDLAYILRLFRKHKSIEKAYEQANTILNEAKAELDIFEDSVEKNALVDISDYVLTRRK